MNLPETLDTLTPCAAGIDPLGCPATIQSQVLMLQEPNVFVASFHQAQIVVHRPVLQQAAAFPPRDGGDADARQLREALLRQSSRSRIAWISRGVNSPNVRQIAS